MGTLLLLSLGAAWAGGLHTGLPVQGVPGLGPPAFEGAEIGWSAALPGPDGQPDGQVRVYVGPTEAAATAWVVDRQRSVQVPLAPVPGLGDEGWAAGEALLLVRDGNVAFQVQVTDPAAGAPSALARTLLAAIEDGPQPWPAGARLQREAGGWRLLAPGAVGWQVEGGRQALGSELFVEPPTRVVTWDAWGRFAVLVP